MHATMVREERLSSAAYMPTKHSSTGRFQIDEKVACLLDSGLHLIAFNTLFRSLFLNQEFHQLAIVEPGTQMVVIDQDRRGPSAIDIQVVLGGKVGSTTLITPAYPVVFVGRPTATDRN